MNESESIKRLSVVSEELDGDIFPGDDDEDGEFGLSLHEANKTLSNLFK